MKILRYLVLLAMFASGAKAQDFDKGVAAYNAGDYQTALKELLPLAEGGDATSQYNVGTIYYIGVGVVQNYVETFKWYKLAACQGLVGAQLSIAAMYEAGEGVTQSNVIAHMWYNIVSANGFKDASKWRAEIAAKMTQEDIAKAQAMAQECISSGYKNCGD